MTRRHLHFAPRSVLIAVAVVIAASAGGWYWHRSSQRQETDNAYVNARIVQVSSLVMGQVVRVAVKDNQYVHQGDVLFEVDRRPFETALGEAEGRLGQAEQGTRQDRSDVLAAQADTARQAADLTNAEANRQRTNELVRQNFMSRQAKDDAAARARRFPGEVDEARLFGAALRDHAALGDHHDAIAEADTLLLTIPNQLGVAYNAHVMEAILTTIAPALGWR